MTAEPSGGGSLSRAPVALYVHVPFCLSRCPYCDFVVYAGADARGPRSRTERFWDALEREVELRADALDAGIARDGPDARTAPDEPGREPNRRRRPLRSVYLGGGTPSLMPAERLARLVDLIERRYGLAPDAEITIEANPGPGERGDLAAFRRAGVTRLSLGAQSLAPAELARLGRRHSGRDIAEAVAEARRAGIASVSLDLLYDVPGQSLESWGESLERTLELEPDHLSLYALTLDDPEAEGLTGDAGDHLPTLPGARRWRDRARPGQDEDRAAAQYELAHARLRDAGWHGYEISNWARPGHESRHNLVYWRRERYEAVGPGAHAFDGTIRRWNAARLDRYLQALTPEGGEAVLPPGGAEVVDGRTAAAEAVVLALRLDDGVPETLATQPPLAAVAPWALEAGLLERVAGPTEDALRLTVRGRLLSNELFARLV